jgi:hypothetical protein
LALDVEVLLPYEVVAVLEQVGGRAPVRVDAAVQPGRRGATELAAVVVATGGGR